MPLIEKQPYTQTEEKDGRLHLMKHGFWLGNPHEYIGNLCLEFGVRHGTSFKWMADVITQRYPCNCLWGFDSWKGLPEESGSWRPKKHSAGRFAVNREDVVKHLASGKRVELDGYRFRLVDGFFDASLTPQLRGELPDLLLKFVNLDCDLYVSTLQALEWITPILVTGTILYFDDWEDEHDEPWGQHLAYLEWQRKGNISCETLVVTDNGRRIIRVV